MMGVVCVYATIAGDIFNYFFFSSREIGEFDSAFELSGIIAANIFGFYVEKTFNYNRSFRVLSILGITSSVALPIILVT